MCGLLEGIEFLSASHVSVQTELKTLDNVSALSTLRDLNSLVLIHRSVTVLRFI